MRINTSSASGSPRVSCSISRSPGAALSTAARMVWDMWSPISEVVRVLPYLPVGYEVRETVEFVALVGEERRHEPGSQDVGKFRVLLQRVERITQVGGEHVRLGRV